jgi:predicted  nucleic acid-binding Zn-ribbon protein
MASTKEQTVGEKLQDLYKLQTIDSKIDEIGILKGALPMEVGDLEDDIVGLEKRISRNEESVEESEKEISRHNGNILDSEALIVKYEKQLESVKNNREYDALNKEIELQRLEILLSQKKIKEIAAKLEVKVETVDASKLRLEAKNRDLENKKVELEKIITKTEKEEAKLQKEADKIRKNIEPRLLKSYDKIRSRYKNGIAVAVVAREACGGCFNRIPPQVIIEIGNSKKIIACEHCGRVLVGPELVGVEVE